MDYAQSRLQARFGDRPDESLWQELEAISEPSATLELARASRLKRWVAGIAAHADSHAIEIALRARWRECIAETASWMPAAWQPALLWTCGLVDLPALAYLARGGTPLPWMFDDPVLHVYARCDAGSLDKLLRESGYAFLVSACEEAPGHVLTPGADHSRICQAWLEEWRRRWPRWGDTASLENLAELLEATTKRPAAIGRPELQRTLRRLFRDSVLRPAAAFVFIVFVALDIERLRAALLRHTLARAGIISS